MLHKIKKNIKKHIDRLYLLKINKVWYIFFYLCEGNIIYINA